MNVEIGDEAALFPEKEYISGIFVAVWSICDDLVLEVDHGVERHAHGGDHHEQDGDGGHHLHTISNIQYVQKFNFEVQCS